MKITSPLRKNSDFQKVYNNGVYYAGRLIVLYIYENKLGYIRLGIVVSKKIGNSVKRNRVRRLIRESYRKYEDNIKTGFDYVFLARKGDTLPDYCSIKKEMNYLLKKLGLYKQEKIN